MNKLGGGIMRIEGSHHPEVTRDSAASRHGWFSMKDHEQAKPAPTEPTATSPLVADSRMRLLRPKQP